MQTEARGPLARFSKVKNLRDKRGIDPDPAVADLQPDSAIFGESSEGNRIFPVVL
jgi:hypothetical protein